MNKIFFSTFFLLITTIKINAQDSESYVKFTPEQISIAKKTSKEQIALESSFNQGVQYQGKNFWFITTKDEKQYYFSSNKTFKNVTYVNDYYSSLMEYVIEKSDF